MSDLALFGTDLFEQPVEKLRYGALLGALLRASRRCPDNTGSTGARAPLWGVTVQNLGSAPTGGLAGADRQRGAES